MLRLFGKVPIRLFVCRKHQWDRGFGIFKIL